jgi:hypothetical protein
VILNGQARSGFTADTIILPVSGTTKFEVEF